MAQIIHMPKMSDTMEEGVIAKWLKKVGDTIQEGDIIAEVETDKATMELESYDEGTLLYVAVEDGGVVPVDGLLAILGAPGEDYKPLLEENGNGQASSSATESAPSGETTSTPTTTEVTVDNATVVTMPKMSDTMEEGVIVSWLKKVGDNIQEGDIIAEVETDKATMELEAYDEGTLLYVAIEEGGSVKVDGLIAVVGEEGANYQALVDQFKSGGSAQEETKSTSASVPKPATSNNGSAPKTPAPPNKAAAHASNNNNSNGRVKISPLARKLASEKGYDISQIEGSGDHGRIIKRDIENFTPAAQPTAQDSAVATAPVGTESYEEINVSQMRKTIAKRLAASKFTAPHFYVTMEIRMDAIMKARKQINAVAPVKVSFNDIIIKASALAIRKHPKINAYWLEDKIRYNNHIHVGMAVAVKDGLFVPVVRFADNLTFSQVATTTKDLVSKAKDKKLQPADWEGSTFSVSNLGMFGVEDFTAIINPPDSCILAVGGIKQTPVVNDEGQIEVGNIMKVTLSSDHRVVDGALAASFLKTLKQMIENPYMMLV
ncbi:pyruvate dehydrogenase complex dihydrolipoamide acetyltransferase [uncultured Microscilla sp.]|uniref:pyruvate dehydrogenase complex dihydrolipoamide acetyltransferase n=1 Tax=uncultured Microscilla sp. TaxID=432653 RepID=UPI00261DB266|nr:pyruvate dehydrogenase complex dihydrolipoamide acetyltransferase [uncultured Microscilla sp.]